MANIARTHISFEGTESDYHRAVEIRQLYDEPLRMWDEQFESGQEGVLTVRADCPWNGDLLLAYVLSRLLTDRSIDIGWFESMNATCAHLTFLNGHITVMRFRSGDETKKWDEESGLLSFFEHDYDDPDAAPYSSYEERLATQEECDGIEIDDAFPAPDAPLPAVVEGGGSCG